jgi:hypothetical protein
MEANIADLWFFVISFQLLNRAKKLSENFLYKVEK